MDKTLVKQMFFEIGVLVQAVGALELALDDLLFLANDRMNNTNHISKRYPRTLKKKLDFIIRVSEILGSEHKYIKNFDRITSFRNIISHGRIINFENKDGEYSLIFSKITDAIKNNGSEKITRGRQILTQSDILETLKNIELAHGEVESIRQSLWRMGEGWPHPPIPPEADPLNVRKPLRVIETHG